jgi:hypothetical protein
MGTRRKRIHSSPSPSLSSSLIWILICTHPSLSPRSLSWSLIWILICTGTNPADAKTASHGRLLVDACAVARDDALLDVWLDEEALHPGGGLRLRANGVEGLEQGHAGLEE